MLSYAILSYDHPALIRILTGSPSKKLLLSYPILSILSYPILSYPILPPYLSYPNGDHTFAKFFTSSLATSELANFRFS